MTTGVASERSVGRARTRSRPARRRRSSPSVRLADSADYRGIITGLRIELTEKPRDGDQVKVQSIEFK